MLFALLVAEEFAQKFNLARDDNEALHESSVASSAAKGTAPTDDDESTEAKDAVEEIVDQVKDLTVDTEAVQAPSS